MEDKKKVYIQLRIISYFVLVMLMISMYFKMSMFAFVFFFALVFNKILEHNIKGDVKND